ncbi:MAG: PspC domain-containing protein [Sphingobacteriaceae bacterium]|nr:PspC domain-containing protein [Sphingobacteriaceae bacterium]
MEKKLYRNLHDRKIAGVASGVANYLHIEVTVVRLLFILSTVFLGGSGLITYIVLWIVSPTNNDPNAKFKKFDDFFNNQKNPFENVVPNKENSTMNTKWNTENFAYKKKDNKKATTIIGVFLLIMGTYFLLDEFDFIPEFVTLGKLWPLLLVFFGVSMLLNSKKNSDFENFKKSQEKASEPIVTPPPASEEKSVNNPDENQN